MPREPRLRDYLTRDEVVALLRSSKKSPRHGARNHAMILLAYRHGLRASEVTGLRWNGNWNDVSSILPIVEPFLAAQGQNPTVTSAFLTLCERAFGFYPMDRFVAQLPLMLGRDEGTPLGWRGTSLPARLAGLIQQFSEKTQPLPTGMARALLRALDALVDMGDRRASAIQTSEVFKDVRFND